MLGLRQQVGGGQRGVGGFVGDHHRLGGAGEPVDADHAKDLALGQRLEQAAGAADLVDAGNARRAIGQRADRLRPAGDIDRVDADDVGRHQDRRVRQSVSRCGGEMTLSGARRPRAPGWPSSAATTAAAPCRRACRRRRAGWAHQLAEGAFRVVMDPAQAGWRRWKRSTRRQRCASPQRRQGRPGRWPPKRAPLDDQCRRAHPIDFARPVEYGFVAGRRTSPRMRRTASSGVIRVAEGPPGGRAAVGNRVRPKPAGARWCFGAGNIEDAHHGHG